MRANRYSILAALLALGALDTPLSHARGAGDSPARPRYYFPREIKRGSAVPAPVDKRAPQLNDQDTTVVVIPVTVYVGPDGKPFTIVGQAAGGTGVTPSSITSSSTPLSSDTASNDPPLNTRPSNSYDGPAHRITTASEPNSSSATKPMGNLSLGLPNLFSTPSASESESETETVSSNSSSSTFRGTGSTAPTVTPSSSSSYEDVSSSSTFPTLELPTLQLPTDGTSTSGAPGGTGTFTREEPTTTSQGPIITLPTIIPDPSPSNSEPSSSSTHSPSRTTRSDVTDTTLLPTSELPTVVPPSSTTSESPTESPTESPSSSPSIPPTGRVTLTPIPPVTNNSTTSTTSSIPSGIFPSSTVVPTGTIPTGTYPSPSRTGISLTPSPSNTNEVTPTPSAPAPTQTETKPLSTDSLTSMYIPTSIVYQPTPVPPNTSQANKPTAIPRIISPDGGIPQAPADSRLVQIGFNGSLPYEFAVKNRDSIIQIFSYTPIGISYGLQISRSLTVMRSIEPYDTVQKNTYTTTLALIYIPENLVTELSVSLHNPFSLIYKHPNPSVAQLMSLIDPSIPLIPGGGPLGQETGGLGGGLTGRPGGGNDDGNDGGSGGNESPGGSGSSSNVRATSVGIGLGVVGGAALYGAAMFFVARRYRKKRKMHRRTSSLTSGIGDNSTPEPWPITSDTLMTGGRGDGNVSSIQHDARNSHNSGGSGSGKTQMISAPVMAENSLGWN
ncbi:hypothetical protein PABG_07713 [Paracoccidioides brasiliensis Pb03]|nr:hypothetical protein PABG_07713 [Paracoccidioides brasiliensis Pb03]